MARKIPSKFDLTWDSNTYRWVISDSKGFLLSDGTAINRTQARELAWLSLEEMGLVTDE